MEETDRSNIDKLIQRGSGTDVGFYKWDIGYAARPYNEEGDYLDVYPSTMLTAGDGEVSNVRQDIITNTDFAGNKSSIVMNHAKLVRCVWYRNGKSNTKTPPLVQVGERINIYKFRGNSELYWWETMDDGLGVRKYDRELKVYSNGKDNNVIAESYYTLVDTVNKIFAIHTPDSDGETTTYDISLDGEAGTATLIDGFGNGLEIESGGSVTTLTGKSQLILTSDNTTRMIGKENVFIHSDKNTLVTTPKFEVDNGSKKLVDTLIRLCDELMAQKHIGNLGIPTFIETGTKDKFQMIQDDLKTFV